MVKFSVVVTTYNREKELKRCLESLVAQSYKNFEVIVYDDGSQDNSKKVVDNFTNQLEIEYIYAENWGGPARGRNVGISKARGEFVAFLDCDDWWYENRLEKLLKYLDTEDVIYHELDYYNFTGKMGNRTTNGRRLLSNAFVDLLTNGNCLSNSATIARRDLLIKVGGISEDDNLKAVEDYDLWVRLSKLTNRFKYVKTSLGAYWVGEDNISIASENYIYKISYLVNKYLPELPKEDQAEALVYLKYIIARNRQAMGKINLKKDFLEILVNSRRPFIKLKALHCLIVTICKSIFQHSKNSTNN
jgi:glycosyltransferase involved in cell wall biosynthesis